MSMALLFLCGHALAEESKTLRLTLPVSADEAIRQIAGEFKQLVESRTTGLIKIELATEGQTYKDNEIVSAVAAGSIEIGGTTLSQFAYDVPLAGLLLQPFMFNFNALVHAAAQPDSEIRQLIDEEILYWTNTRVLWWQPNGANVIFAKGGPLTGASITDLAVGAPDDQSKELTRVCGGTAYLIPNAELRTALAEGKIRVAMTEILSIKAHELWRVADTIVNTQHAPSLYVFVVNDRIWQTLSSDHQQTIMAAARETQERTWDRFATTEAEAYAFAAEKGMRVYDLSQADVEEWRACSSPLLEAYMERVGEPGLKLFVAYGKLRTDPCCREAPVSAATARQ
jgi:TRAP-type C4-dicarboxylate transport system substrate-binding protein